MRRFFVQKITEPILTLTGAEHRHLSEVLRGKKSEKVIICVNDGYDNIYEIISFDKNSTTLEFVERRFNGTETKLELTVFFSMLKGDKGELVVTKLTELGAKHIVPFISEYTVKVSEKTERLERAAIEASKQCGRAVLPTVSPVIKFEDIPDMLPDYDKVVFAYEGAYNAGKRIKDIVTGNEKSVALIIGAEGGFNENEVRLLTDAGIPAVTLGKRILRAETASIAASAVILHICGEWE